MRLIRNKNVTIIGPSAPFLSTGWRAKLEIGGRKLWKVQHPL